MRALLIHDADATRDQVAQDLAAGLPDGLLELWDPIRQGAPGRGFQWHRHAIIFLDERPGNGDGIDWLLVLRDAMRAGLVPPMVLLAHRPDPDRERRAREAGASDYLIKTELSANRVAETVRRAIRTAAGRPWTPDPDPGTPGRNGTAMEMVPSRMPFAIPGYRLLRKLAEGGMSKVFLAERETDRSIVVLKMLDPRLNTDPLFRQRFVREYRILQRIHNRHVVSILDQGMADDYGFIAMEYFPGGDLKSLIRPPGLAPPVALRHLRQIATGLAAVHAADVVHRDLKPQNIMFRSNGELAILDFGLARELDSTATLTQNGVVLATPLYMSPEQCLGLTHEARGDLYSTGILFFEMLTGRTPYIGNSPPELAYQHVHGPLPRLPGYLLSLQPTLNHLLAKKPEDRFQSAAALLEHLQSLDQG